ncbi:hypothetical protein LINPERPRIM_LOCUS36305 [Linum perenne]
MRERRHSLKLSSSPFHLTLWRSSSSRNPPQTRWTLFSGSSSSQEA